MTTWTYASGADEKDKCDLRASGSSGGVQNILKSWKNPNFRFAQGPETTKHLARNLKEPFTFKREMFKNIKVLGQADKKFIACKTRFAEGKSTEDCLVLFDQHAVHERIRLETLIKGIIVL